MFQSLKSLLPGSIHRAGAVRQVEAVEILKMFRQVMKNFFDDDIIKYAYPIYFKDGVVAVQCKSSLAAQELRYRETDIIDALNNKIGSRLIKKLRYIS